MSHSNNNDATLLLRDKIAQFIDKREYPKTCCPSEVARALTARELQSLGCGDWRDAMQPVRETAWQMQSEGLLQIIQKGEPVQAGSLDEIKGPIRLRAAKQ